MKINKKNCIEFLSACAIIGTVNGLTHKGEFWTDLWISVGCGAVLAIVRVIVGHFKNEEK